MSVVKSQMSYIDTHAHLNFKAFINDLDQVIKKAKKKGVKKIIIPGAKLESSAKAVEIASKYPNCFASVGVHPHHALSANANKISAVFNRLIESKKVVAIGEIGLDYHQYRGYPPISQKVKEVQKKLLLFQLNIALKNNLPAIFHCRGAYDDMLETVGFFLKKNKVPKKGVFHCFEGQKTHVEKILNFGFYIGFDGNITYEENSHLRLLVKETPIDRLLLETDSPFLAPLSKRGKRNEPSNISEVAKQIADIKKTNIKQIAFQTSLNARKLFNI